MDQVLAVVFDFERGEVLFRLFEREADVLDLQLGANLSAAEFFESCGIVPERVRQEFPSRVTATGELGWIMPQDLPGLYGNRPDLQKLANMLGLTISVFRWRPTESPVEEFRLHAINCR